jgi:palmitoyl transferase
MTSSLRLSALLVALAVLSRPAFAQETAQAPSGTAAKSPDSSTWLSSAGRHIKDTWQRGGLDLYVPLYTYHMPYAYTPELLHSYNDFPEGGGIGKGRFNASGNWEGMVAMEFADSHGRPEYLAAYLWIPTWHPLDNGLRLGAGLAGGLTARSDIHRYTPFPGGLPVVSIGYRFLDIQATFVPGFKDDGNVLFCWAKLSFY